MRIDLTGTWECRDYECPHGTKNTELVAITPSGEKLVATKITGDDCVPAGYETFSGRLPTGATIAAIVWTTGLPRAPATGSAPGFLRIVDRTPSVPVLSRCPTSCFGGSYPNRCSDADAATRGPAGEAGGGAEAANSLAPVYGGRAAGPARRRPG